MPYTLNFSDPSNLNTITVPDYPPGLNAVDTSLSFIGKSYPNYGQVVDQNFLKLLENFAGPLQPGSPTKGQLWYDSYTRTLKLFDGNVWKAANGIYQQPTDPAVAAPVSYGDIWVDTQNTLLKIRGAGSWVQVGPSISEGTGITTESLTDANNPLTVRTVLVVKVNGTVVAVYNDGDSFTPATYPSGMLGFTNIVKGITLPEAAPNNFVIKGTANNSLQLAGFVGSSYLRKDDSSSGGQLITGKVVYVTPATGSGENRDGIIIRTSGENPSLNFIQFFKKGNDAIISNEVKAGKIILKVKGLNDTNQTSALVIEKNKITVQGDLAITSGTFTATNIRVTSTANAISSQTGAIVVEGGLGVAKDIHFGGDLYQRGVLFNPVGTVLNVLVASANGFGGSVATPTTTPVITLRTTVSGILKGNGTAVSAAAAGTDYQAPLTLTTVGSSGAATLVGNTLNIPQYSGGGGGLGTVTSVSVATANGFAGSVANASTTPAITLSTNVTGLLKGNGTAMSAATAGTDYLAPIVRTTVTGSSGSIANGATANISVTGFKGYLLYKIQTTAAAWVRLYTDAASRTADASRAQGVDPSPNAGVIAEVITTGAQTVIFSPAAAGFNNESPVTTAVPVAVTNNSGGTTSIDVTLTLLQTET